MKIYFKTLILLVLCSFGLEEVKSLPFQLEINWQHVNWLHEALSKKTEITQKTSDDGKSTQNSFTIVSVTSTTPTSFQEKSNDNAPADVVSLDGENHSQNAKLDKWKLVFLGFSASIALFLTLRCLCRAIPSCFENPRQTRRTSRQQRMRPPQPPCIVHHGHTRNLYNCEEVFHFDSFSPHSNEAQGDSPTFTSPIHQKSPVSDSGEPALYVAEIMSDEVDDRPQCETPPPPYSLSMASQ